MASTTEVFSKIFHGNSWRGESKSGPGSTLNATSPIRAALSDAFQRLGIRSLIDAPCGTAEWIPEVTGALDTYLGFDVVPDLIATASRENTRSNHFFMAADIITAILPRADAIFCRDCLVHLPLDMALAAIQNFKASGSTYLMTTTFPDHLENPDIRMGSWRPLNLEAAPFNFPPPAMLLPDRPSMQSDPYADKSIGVWRIADL